MKGYFFNLLVVLLFVVACGKSGEFSDKSKAEASAAEILGKSAPAPDSSLSTAMIGNTKDTTRKFIKTVDMKFRVDNVFQKSLKVETLCRKYDGFIILSDLQSNNNYTEVNKISEDSSVETIHYIVNNTIKLRIPVEKLDSVLNDIYKMVDYLDYKTIQATDVGLQFLANKKRVERRESFEKNVRKGNKKGNVIGESIVLDRQEEADASTLSNMQLIDEIKFSTVTLQLYQREQLKRTVIPNDKGVKDYEPNFGRKLIQAVKDGWTVLQNLILFFVSIWSVILFVLLTVFAVKRYIKRKK